MKVAPEQLDATDGLAVAVCHYFQKGQTGAEKKFTGWKSYLTANPDKIG